MVKLAQALAQYRDYTFSGLLKLSEALLKLTDANPDGAAICSSASARKSSCDYSHELNANSDSSQALTLSPRCSIMQLPAWRQSPLRRALSTVQRSRRSS